MIRKPKVQGEKKDKEAQADLKALPEESKEAIDRKVKDCLADGSKPKVKCLSGTVGGGES